MLSLSRIAILSIITHYKIFLSIAHPGVPASGAARNSFLSHHMRILRNICKKINVFCFECHYITPSLFGSQQNECAFTIRKYFPIHKLQLYLWRLCRALSSPSLPNQKGRGGRGGGIFLTPPPPPGGGGGGRPPPPPPPPPPPRLLRCYACSSAVSTAPISSLRQTDRASISRGQMPHICAKKRSRSPVFCVICGV